MYCEQELANGSLVQLLPEWSLPGAGCRRSTLTDAGWCRPCVPGSTIWSKPSMPVGTVWY